MLRRMLAKCFMTLLKSFFPFLFCLDANIGNIFFFKQVFPSSAPSDSISILSFSSSEVHCFAKSQRKVY